MRISFAGTILSLLCLIGLGVGVEATPRPQVPVIGADAVTTPQAAATAATPDGATPANLYHHAEHSRVYVVQPGDTLWTVALEVGLDLASMPCVIAPTFQPEQPLVIGDQLEIPNSPIICHRVDAGESLQSIAAAYQTTPAAIAAIEWNDVAHLPATTALPVGRHVRMTTAAVPAPGNGLAITPPDATGVDDFFTWMLEQPLDTSPFMALAVGGAFSSQLAHSRQQLGRATVDSDNPGAVPEYWPYGSGEFVWPLAGWLTQGYRYDHRAIDVAAPHGTLVTAADRGVVMRAGWNAQGYGLFVVIDHNIDYVTLYAHLSEIFVTEGQVVAQGDPLGRVGSTGNSTGPHLHFEIRDFGRLTNPLELLVR